MKNKLFLAVIVLCTFIIQLTFVTHSLAAEASVGKKGETNVELSIGEVIEKKIPPSVYKPEVTPTVQRLLPKTNEMINTLLVLLTAICIFLLILGLFMFRRIYENNDYMFV